MESYNVRTPCLLTRGKCLQKGVNYLAHKTCDVNKILLIQQLGYLTKIQ